jgi:hypothetical protein
MLAGLCILLVSWRAHNRTANAKLAREKGENEKTRPIAGAGLPLFFPSREEG